MDVQTQRACAARLEEPLFCPSNLTSLIPHSSFDILPDLTTDSNIGPGSTAHSIESQNVDGPVSQSGADTVSDPPSLPNEIVLPAAQSSSSSGQQHLYHPRPESHEISREEDGRRTRFALEDSNEYTGLLQRLLHLTAIPDGFDWPIDGTVGAGETEPDRPSGSSGMYTLSPRSGLPLIYEYDTEDDALAVDDPRRAYDFREFMQRQNSTEYNYKEGLSSELDICYLLSTSLDDVTREDTKPGDSDIQGIRWNRSELHRDQVLESRRAQHPCRRNLSSCRHPASVETTSQSEVQYRFRSFSPRDRAHYSHYQLRNVLAAVNRNDIFYSTGRKVIQTTLACPSIGEPVMDLSRTPNSPSGIRITCLSATAALFSSAYRADKVLLAGGFGGEYAMLDLNSDDRSTFHSGFVTHDYNGLVTHVGSYADRRSGALRACLCSNDRKVRIMDVKTKRFINTFSYETALNCSALSPDGRLRALVGDSHETLITDAEKGNILLTLQEHNDHGFACAWSADGRHMATGAQDGLVVLWDSRNWSVPLRKMDCVMATARSLHFASDGALVVAEDDDVVTIYDTTRPEMRQDIRFFGSVAGVAMLNGGDELVVANADKTVGGLMSFQRTPQGLGGGTFGECLDRTWLAEAMPSRRCRSVPRVAGHRRDIVSEIMV